MGGVLVRSPDHTSVTRIPSQHHSRHFKSTMLTADPSPPVPRRPSLIVTSEDDDASDADSFYSAEDSGEPPWWTRTERATASSSSTQKKNEALGLEEAFESVFRDETGEGPEPIAELFTPDATESPLEEPARNHVATPEPSAERKEVVDQPGTRQFSESDSDEEILNERNGNADAEGTEEIEELLSPAETEVRFVSSTPPSPNKTLSKLPRKSNQRLLKESQELKESGNQFFALGRFGDALDDYKNALAKCPKSCRKERAVYHANAAACHMKLEQWKEAVKACGLGGFFLGRRVREERMGPNEDGLSALEDDPNYTKALLRRAQANEKLDTSTSLSAALEGGFGQGGGLVVVQL